MAHSPQPIRRPMTMAGDLSQLERPCSAAGTPAHAQRRTLTRVSLLWACALWMFGPSSLLANQTPGSDQNACPAADPAYIRTANETGGIPMFLLRSEAAKAFHCVRESARKNLAMMFWATGNLDGTIQTAEIPVDSVTTRITFTFSANTAGDKMVLTQPSGEVTTEGAANTEITELNCGRVVTVASPQPGVWRVEITGRGTYWMEATGQSDIDFLGVRFVKQGGRPGHEGLFPIQGQPLAGAPATLQASLSAAATKTTEFHLVTERAETIEEVTMQPVNSDREFLELVGNVDLPSVPFRVAVMGLDLQGRPYQRFFPRLFHAENVELSPRLDFDELSAGSTKQADFAVRNIGSPRTFRITATDVRHFVSRFEPKELSLGENESGIIRVDLAVPAEIGPGIGGDDVVIVATSVAGGSTSNSAVVHFSVSRSGACQNPR